MHSEQGHDFLKLHNTLRIVSRQLFFFSKGGK